jgi:gamma-glutamyltranspeptidase/glutathione hydrolase
MSVGVGCLTGAYLLVTIKTTSETRSAVAVPRALVEQPDTMKITACLPLKTMTSKLRRRLSLVALWFAASAMAFDTIAQIGRPSQPEPASGYTQRTLAHAQRYMVAAANPLAVEAGLAMLDKGGSAMDAAIATQLVLNLVEPHASGLGGGAFLLYFDALANAVRAYDGRETAPADATPALFLRDDGKPMAFRDAVTGGRAVGVPGLARLLELAHRRHGKLPWPALLEPAITLAENGYPLTPRVHRLLGLVTELDRDPAARALYFDASGAPKPAGTILRNPEFAATLRALANDGADAFYKGAIARDIVAAVRDHSGNPGLMTERDLASYGVREVEPLCRPYRVYRICAMPPSSSGGIAVLQMLGMLERFDLSAVRPSSSNAVHLLAEAGRLAFADRDRYVADDRFVNVPMAGLVEPGYLASRSQLIRPESSMGKAAPGVPRGAVAHADGTHDYSSGTSHISIIDGDGNAVSMTTTIESFFGARIMARGFLLNNQLTDFNFVPTDGSRPVANRVEPGKRPRSSMAPTLVFDQEGKLLMTVGSPGGSQIINYVLKALVATLDWRLDIQAAIDLPNAGSRNGPTELESGTDLHAIAPTLKGMGHDVRIIDMTSGLHGVVRSREGLTGGADPRREGVARGR